MKNKKLKMVNNFRDLGGYKTNSGHTIKPGFIFRSGHLGDLSKTDYENFSSLDVKSNFDLRSDKERNAKPNLLPASTQIIKVPIIPGNKNKFFEWLKEEKITENELIVAMEEIYQDLVLSYTASYKQVFNSILNGEQQPILINCSLGKDRTGIMSALILTALDVPKETIIDDYLLSNNMVLSEDDISKLAKMYELHSNTSSSCIKALLGVRSSYIEMAFETINKEYGSLSQYINSGLDLDKEKLQILKRNFLS